MDKTKTTSTTNIMITTQTTITTSWVLAECCFRWCNTWKGSVYTKISIFKHWIILVKEIEAIYKCKTNKNEGFYATRNWKKKKHQMVPPLDHFQGKNETRSSFARIISTSSRSFFENLTTFERRSGLKVFSLLKKS